MLPQERLNDIVRKVTQEGSVRVRDLAVLYGVSEDCIRKDLTGLEKQGLLQRTHGGALPVRVNIHEMTVAGRKEKNQDQKIAIAKKALEQIHEGDMIFLDISTTNLELARLLASCAKNVTVVTNMIDAMQALAHCHSIKTIFIGGTFNQSCDGFIGSLADSQIRNYRFDIAFLGTVGVDVFDNSVMTYAPEDGQTKAVVLSVSRKSFLVMEEQKFHNAGTYEFAKLDEVSGIITNTEPPANICRKLEKEHIELIA